MCVKVVELLELAETRVALRQKRVEQDQAQLATVPCSQVASYAHINFIRVDSTWSVDRYHPSSLPHMFIVMQPSASYVYSYGILCFFFISCRAVDLKIVVS